MLSKKYCQMLANTIKNSKDLDEFKNKLCYELKSDNWNFNRDLFLKACENKE